ncbi:MAG: hypothetical protein IPP94_04560 [Ignavibacteria bacterium]|nr:hypothetical protein [Ignavibacteria bacterium]
MDATVRDERHAVRKRQAVVPFRSDGVFPDDCSVALDDAASAQGMGGAQHECAVIDERAAHELKVGVRVALHRRARKNFKAATVPQRDRGSGCHAQGCARGHRGDRIHRRAVQPFRFFHPVQSAVAWIERIGEQRVRAYDPAPRAVRSLDQYRSSTGGEIDFQTPAAVVRRSRVHQVQVIVTAACPPQPADVIVHRRVVISDTRECIPCHDARNADAVIQFEEGQFVCAICGILPGQVHEYWTDFLELQIHPAHGRCLEFSKRVLLHQRPVRIDQASHLPDGGVSVAVEPVVSHALRAQGRMEVSLNGNFPDTRLSKIHIIPESRNLRIAHPRTPLRPRCR